MDGRMSGQHEEALVGPLWSGQGGLWALGVQMLVYSPQICSLQMHPLSLESASPTALAEAVNPSYN